MVNRTHSEAPLKVPARSVRFLLAAVLLAAPPPLAAQADAKVYRVGMLTFAPARTPRTQAFLQGLRDHGYVEGKHFILERRSAAKGESADELAAELVRAKVDVILAAGTAATLHAVRATKTIPIVFVAAYPVERGIVKSLARPGTNATGVALQVGLEKHLQLLHEMVPDVSRVAYFYTATTGDEYLPAYLAGLQAHARGLKVQLDAVDVRAERDIEQAFAQFSANGTNGLLIDNPSLLLRLRERICGLALKHRLPAMGRGREFADSGCLMSYGENLEEVYRRLGTYVAKVLKGANPAELPVEGPSRFDLLINRKTAKALGVAIPPALQVRADRIID